jgi:hypothetical protein
MPDETKLTLKQQVNIPQKNNDSKEKEIKTKILEEAEVWLKKKQKLLQLSEIGLTLDTYDDIFSDFDPRAYSDRALSDDFLSEIKRATREKISGVIELKFLIPKTLRNLENEELIKKRLKNHFRRHYEMLRKEVNAVKNFGTIMVIGGFFLGVIAVLFLDAILLETIDHNLFFTNIFYWFWLVLPKVLLVLIEPASWFLIWEGMGKIVFEWKELKPDLEFYEKMTKCEILFEEY